MAQPAEVDWSETFDAQLPGESKYAYRAFTIYRDLGHDRTVLNAFKIWRRERGNPVPEGRKGAANGQWSAWSSKFKWIQRARAYDRHWDRIRMDAREQAARDDARVWQNRQRELLDNEARVGQMFFELVTTLAAQLQGSTKTVVSPDGKTVKHIQRPSKKWSANSLANMAKVGSLLQRAAMGMPIQPAEEQPPPENFMDSMYERPEHVVKNLPPGAMPDMPEDRSKRPALPAEIVGGNGNGHDIHRPPRERP